MSSPFSHDDPFIIHEDHLYSALAAAVPTIKEEEEKRNGEGWCSCNRTVLEEALQALSERRRVKLEYRR